jgi:hypothetical protein
MNKVNAPANDTGRPTRDRNPRGGALIIGFDQRFARIRHEVTDLRVGTDRSWTEPWTRSLQTRPRSWDAIGESYVAITEP